MEALKKNEKPIVFKYHDYVGFLRDYVSFLKSTPEKITLRALATKAGISPSLLAMSLTRQRRMTERVFSKLSATLELSKNERLVLRLLRTLAESEAQIERTEALEELQKVNEYRRYNQDSSTVFKYLSNWLNVALRELMFLPEFRMDTNWIQKKILSKPTQKEINDSINFLKNNGYIRTLPDGKMTPNEQHLDCSEGVFKISLGEFHRQMLQMAEQSIEEVERDLRLILGHTFAMGHQNLPEIKNILNEALKKIETLNNNKEIAKTDVYHLEISLFPLTTKALDEGESYE